MSGRPDETLPHDGADDEAAEERLGRVIAAYLDACRAGQAPDRCRLLEEHPDLADELAAFFANHDRMERLSGPAGFPGAPTSLSLHRAEATPDPKHFPTVALPSDAAAADPGQPARFGDYELLGEIARGGMGVVYRARQRSLNRIVALKMIRAGRLASASDIERFRIEAQAAATLQHPNIVAIYEVGQCEGQHYFAMEYVEGESLAQRIASGSRPPRESAALLRTIAETIHYAHEHGVIHRDLKPANILLDSSGRPRVTDFGLAKRAGEGGLTATRAILGTPAFMAPEQVQCARAVGPAADIYSLGALLFTLLTGRPPIVADSEFDAFLQVLESEPDSPRRLNRAVDRDLETICLKCLEKDPQRRYASAQELADDLGRYLAGEPIRARPLRPLGRLARWGRNRPALAVTLAGLALFYGHHLAVHYAFPDAGENAQYRQVFQSFVTTLVLVWTLGAVVFQYLARRPGASRVVTYGWATMDVLLFTAFLLVGHGLRSSVLIGYPLLVAGAALRFRVGLVWYMAAVCAVGYLGLVLDAAWFRPNLQLSIKFHAPFLLGLAIVALVQHHVLRRIRRIDASKPAGRTAS